MRIFFVPRTTGDIVSFASTTFRQGNEKANPKDRRIHERNQNLQAQRKIRQDEPWIRRQSDCVHCEDMKINEMR